MNISHLTLAHVWRPVAASVAIVVLLAACSKQDDMAGMNPPSSPSGTAAEAGAEIRKETSEAAKAVVDTARDVAITTEVNTLFARDDQLSMMKIDVDTTAGQIVLQGTAPTDAARSRAAQLAQSVGGVLGVDNQLKIASN